MDISLTFVSLEAQKNAYHKTRSLIIKSHVTSPFQAVGHAPADISQRVTDRTA